MVNSTWLEGDSTSLTYRLKKMKVQSTLCHSSQHVATRWRGCLEGRFERPTPENMRFYALSRAGSLGTLAFRGGHRSKRYRKIWPPRGKPRLFAPFQKRSWLFFQRGEANARTWYAWVETRPARLESARACLLRIKYWLIGSYQIISIPHPSLSYRVEACSSDL